MQNSRRNGGRNGCLGQFPFNNGAVPVFPEIFAFIRWNEYSCANILGIINFEKRFLKSFIALVLNATFEANDRVQTVPGKYPS